MDQAVQLNGESCARAKSAGASRVYWIIHQSNTTARALYDQAAHGSNPLTGCDHAQPGHGGQEGENQLGDVIGSRPVSSQTATSMTRVTSTRLTRATEVVLKEWRRPMLMLREMSLHASQLHAMQALFGMRAIIAPLLPACYAEPLSLGGMVDQTIGRVPDVFDIDIDFTCRRREGN